MAPISMPTMITTSYSLQVPTCLTVAHLDHKAGRNDPDNLAWLCWTHHWMFDADFYPIEAIRLMRQRWQDTKGVSPADTDDRCWLKGIGHPQAK
jgi:hypothetical protein